MKDYKEILLRMIRHGQLDWELVGRELLNIVSNREVKDLLIETCWINEDC